MEDNKKKAAEMFKRLVEKMNNARTEATPHCTDGEQHKFETISHMDGRESYARVYECSKCGEVVKKETKRTGMDKALWS